VKMLMELESIVEGLRNCMSEEGKTENPGLEIRFSRIKKIISDLFELEEQEPDESELA